MRIHIIYLLLTLMFILFGASSCYLTRAIRYRNFELKDLPEFLSDTIEAGNQPFHFYDVTTGKTKPIDYLDTGLVKSHTYSFLVIRNDSILYEFYQDGLNTETLLPSFSVAKSFVSTLVGIALEEGAIKSLNEPITNYIPELLKSDYRLSDVTIQHVLDMRSGIKSNEDYSNRNSNVLKLGFGSNIWNIIKKTRLERPPGDFDYKSANTQILGIILERATGRKLQDYMEEKLWKPLGMEKSATWNIDNKKNRTVRAFCCINSATRDMAKLGRLYLKKGNWNGMQIISNSWVNQCTDMDSLLNNEGYKNQWWGNATTKSFKDSTSAANYIVSHSDCIPVVYLYEMNKGKPDYRKIYYTKILKSGFHADGLLDQFIYVNPVKGLIIVRTGHGWQHPDYRSCDQFIYSMDERFF